VAWVERGGYAGVTHLLMHSLPHFLTQLRTHLLTHLVTHPSVFEAVVVY
jgi:hypothetical protein